MKYTLLFLLTKVGDSIQKLKLEMGLKIEAINQKDIPKKFANLENEMSSEGIHSYMWSNNVLNSNTKKIYTIAKTFNFDDHETKKFGGISKLGIIQKELIFGYLDPLIIKLRLFKEGNIGYLKYYFYGKSGVGITGSNFATQWGTDYELTDEESKKFDSFSKSIKLPENGSLKIAIDNFNQSYSKINYELQFLSLMIAMEALYSTNQVELTFRLTRNCAIFIGETKEKAQFIYKDFKRLYGIRSGLIHGNLKSIETKEIHALRDYVRKSLVRYLLIGKNPSIVIQELDELGFGDYNKI